MLIGCFQWGAGEVTRKSNDERTESLKKRISILTTILLLLFGSYIGIEQLPELEALSQKNTETENAKSLDMTASDIEISEAAELTHLQEEIPFIEINGNVPQFSEIDKERTDAFEMYSDLDCLGRCGAAYANICKELMPVEKRGEIGHIKPSGWVQEKYAGIVNSNPPYLYNRCHLIGFQLAGENANEKNLITGTRYLNISGMLVWENQVAEYVKETENHVLYRVTPIFVKNELVCRGVHIEAWSVEDEGRGICFSVFCPNVQPGITIDYTTGESFRNDE